MTVKNQTQSIDLYGESREDERISDSAFDRFKRTPLNIDLLEAVCHFYPEIVPGIQTKRPLVFNTTTVLPSVKDENSKTKMRNKRVVSKNTKKYTSKSISWWTTTTSEYITTTRG